MDILNLYLLVFAAGGRLVKRETFADNGQILIT